MPNLFTVSIVPSEVKVTFCPDVLTEESVEVPIQAVNMPQGKVLRTFPSKVKVIFTTGASMFRSIQAANFNVIVYEACFMNKIVFHHAALLFLEDSWVILVRLYPP